MLPTSGIKTGPLLKHIFLVKGIFTTIFAEINASQIEPTLQN